MKGIYKFYAFYANSAHMDEVSEKSELTGIFVAKESDVTELVKSNKKVYFGECFGKNHEITFKVREDHITHVTSDQEFVKLFEQYDMETGINPVHTYQDALEDGLYGDEEE